MKAPTPRRARTRLPTEATKWVNPNGTPTPKVRSTGRPTQPGVNDEIGFNTVLVSNPADQIFFPSPGQPVSTTPNDAAGDDRNK